MFLTNVNWSAIDLIDLVNLIPPRKPPLVTLVEASVEALVEVPELFRLRTNLQVFCKSSDQEL